jgi:hypothetical protein
MQAAGLSQSPQSPQSPPSPLLESPFPTMDSQFPFSPRSAAQSPSPRSLPDLIRLPLLACAEPSQPTAGAQSVGAQPAGAQPAGAQPAGAQPAGAQPVGTHVRTPQSPQPHARSQPSAPRKFRTGRRRSEEESSSSSSEDTLWPPSLMPPARERPHRAPAATHGAWRLHSKSMPDLRTPVRPVATPLANSTGRRVLLLDSAVSNSVVASLAIDAFVFAVAWAPFSFYGALLFVVAQRLTFFFVESHTRHAVLE